MSIFIMEISTWQSALLQDFFFELTRSIEMVISVLICMHDLSTLVCVRRDDSHIIKIVYASTFLWIFYGFFSESMITHHHQHLLPNGLHHSTHPAYCFLSPPAYLLPACLAHPVPSSCLDSIHSIPSDLLTPTPSLICFGSFLLPSRFPRFLLCLSLPSPLPLPSFPFSRQVSSHFISSFSFHQRSRSATRFLPISSTLSSSIFSPQLSN